MTPLVSIGIPTYNRPDGLLRTIKHIASQTYTNLEILVSNNASPNPMVAALLARCAELDPRIRVVNQAENLGLHKNFQYVLNHTQGEYFMWAADDDEWEPTFIAVCVGAHLANDVGTVMPGFLRHNRALGLRGTANLPLMTGRDRFADANLFYESLPHSIFYGLHRRSTVAWFGSAPFEGWDDELFVLRQIIEHGVLTMPQRVLYVAGIEDATYQIKFPKEAEDRHFFWGPRLLNYAQLLLNNQALSDIQKLDLMRRVLMSKLKFVLNYDAQLRQPEQLALSGQIYHFLAQLNLGQLRLYTHLLAQTNNSLEAQAEARQVAVVP